MLVVKLFIYRVGGCVSGDFKGTPEVMKWPFKKKKRERKVVCFAYRVPVCLVSN